MRIKLIQNNKEIEPILNGSILLNAKTNNKIQFICSQCGEETIKTIQSFSMRGIDYTHLDLSDESTLLCKKCLRKYLTKQKYGVENISQLEEVKNKKKETTRKHLGVDYPQQNKGVREKTRLNNIKKYGVDNPAKLKENIEKGIQTKLDRYNKLCFVESPFKDKKVREKAISSIKKTYFEKTVKSLEDVVVPLFSLEEYIRDSEKKLKWKCVKCNSEFESSIYSNHFPLCKKCYPPNYIGSSQQTEITEFIKEFYNGKIIENDRSILKSKEIDIFLPEKKIAIEFDGLYWHNEEFVGEKYHLEKTNECNEKNIRLIHIFEDEWIYKKDIVKSRLKNLIVKNNTRIYARKCEIKNVSTTDKNIFLEKNHIQGKDNSSIRLGLYFNNELVSIMTFSKPRVALGAKNNKNSYELVRFCNKINHTVIGGASKLLKYFERNYSFEMIYSYSDKRWSNGNIYKILGFDYEKTSKPNYWYIKGIKRIHRFNFRKNVLKEKLDLFDENLTEVQNMYLNKYKRIFDCGNDKWIKIQE